MTLRTKILSLITAIAAISFVVAGLSAFTMRQYSDRVDALTTASQRVFNGEHLNRLVTAVVMESRGTYMAEDTAKAKPYADGILAALKDIDGVIAEWRPLVPEDQRAAFEAVAKRAVEFKTFRTETARLGVNDSPAAANKQGNNDANRTNRKQFQQEIDTLVAQERKNLDAMAEAMEAFAHGRTLVVTIVSVAGGLIGLLLGAWFAAVSITRPLGRATQALDGLAGGDLGVTIEASSTKDEIGRIWRSLATFRDHLVEADTLRAREAETERDRQQQRAADMAETARRLEAEVGAAITGLAAGAAKSLEAAKMLSSQSDLTSERSAGVASASEQTAANVQAVATASEELAASIGEISRQVASAGQLIEDTVHHTDATTTEVRELAAAADKVGAIVAMIQAIAGQTNLLALNATIEAARAGEAGRGFAVVASEVKALATQTAQATQDIEQQMAAIQAATERTVGKIGGISERVGNLERITSAIDASTAQQNQATGEISRAIAEAAGGAGDVTRHIQDVRSAATTGGNTARDLLATAEDLASRAGGLQASLARFLDGIRAA
jgi:methyl-accepting chemotaxis protein